MDLSTITVDDFKALFTRDFPYLPTFSAANYPYNAGALVYYPTTKLFYTANKNGVVSIPTTALDWVQTPDDITNYVQDLDITRAFGEAIVSCNQDLLGPDSTIKLGFLYLTAHYLVNDLNTAATGLAGGGSFALTSRSVGSVSETYNIPPRFANDPLVSFYAQSRYGAKYLNFVLPNLVGNFFAVEGGTNA